MNVFIDIEVTPTGQMPTIEDIKYPANYKDPVKIRAYQEENQLEQYKKWSLDAHHNSIIVIGYAIDDDPVQILSCHANYEDEFYMLLQFTNIFGDYHAHTLIGWNCLSFDIPILWRHAIKFGNRRLRDAMMRGRRDGVIDLMKTWSSEYKDYNKLSIVADFIGIPRMNDGFDGSQVFDAYLAGDMAKIEAHCAEDVFLTREVYRKIYQ